MILVDANIFMYAAGAEHPHKAPSENFLAQAASGALEAVLDAETLQEILHRYRSIGRWSDGRRVYDLARQIIPLVIPITAEVLDASRNLMDEHSHLSARDALHAAVAFHLRARAICTYDRDFDRIPGLQRMEPRAVS